MQEAVSAYLTQSVATFFSYLSWCWIYFEWGNVCVDEEPKNKQERKMSVLEKLEVLDKLDRRIIVAVVGSDDV
jgi:hypothetical protein